MNRYNNYHKHDHISSIFTPDSNVKNIDYVNRCLELNEPNYFTTNHGSGGDIFDAKTKERIRHIGIDHTNMTYTDSKFLSDFKPS